MRTRKDHPNPGRVEEKISDVGRDLAQAFASVLEAIPGGPHRPQSLARSLGVNTVLTSRILKAAQQHDPLAVAHMIPGPEPLRRLLRAAEQKKVSRSLIQEASTAVDRFEQLISMEAGDRSALDALISGWLPDAREKVELLAKQAVFRGMSHLLGAACDAEHQAIIFHPGRGRSDRADAVCILITRGLRRVRPGLMVKYDTVHAGGPRFTIKGEPVDDMHGLLLEQFCSQPIPQLQVTHLGDRAQYTLRGDAVGVRSAINLAHATFLPDHKERHRSPGEPERKAVVAAGVSLPSRAFTFDLLVHEDIYPGQQPTLQLYRGTVGDGVVDAANFSGAVNRIDVLESMEVLGQGLSRLRSVDTPNCREIVRHVCDERGWNPDSLRAYRCRIEYPIYSSQVVMAFDLPSRREV